MHADVITPTPAGLHVAIIMDGNGRWANARGLPRAAGHRKGARTVRTIVEAAREMGVGTLTVYAFSADNWERPPREVGALMRLFRAYLAAEVQRCLENGVRMLVVGRRDRLSRELCMAIEAAEAATAGCGEMRFRIALDYSARDAVLHAASLAEGRTLSRDEFSRLLGVAIHDPEGVRDVDLLIRTGGEQRLSDFLLWECAYAEFSFTPRMWPEFGPADLEAAIREFSVRERRFGKVLQATG